MRAHYTTLLIVALCLLFNYNNLSAQGSTPCTAATISTGNSSILVDSGSTTGDYGPTPSCGAYTTANGCVNGWYVFTNTAPVPVNFDINATSIIGGDIDATLVLYSSSDNTCSGTFTQLDCENEGTDGDATIDVTALSVPAGGKIWIRLFDFNCNNNAQINITSINITETTSVINIDDVNNQTFTLDCGTLNTVLYTIRDNNGSTSSQYLDQNDTKTVTFQVPAGCQIWLKEEPVAIGATTICPATSETASDCANSDINDYLKIYDGGNLVNNVIGISLSTDYRFGNFKSTSGEITLEWKTGMSGHNAGFLIDIYTTNDVIDNGTTTVTCGSTVTFTDPGGTGADYGNNQLTTWTFCPEVACTDVICVDMGTTDFEEYFDALYVFDGNSTTAPLHSIFQGASNPMGRLRAMPSNSSGCLTFLLISDAGVDRTGWNASVTTCEVIGPNGADFCADALDISSGGTYHCNTFRVTGEPNETDPAISSGNPVTDGTCFPTESTTSDITQLESTIWYKFTTPSDICSGTPVELTVSNVSCIVVGTGPSTAGAQFALYKTSTCLTPANWKANQIFCADIIVNGSVADFTDITFEPSTTYYILVDAFAGRNCELDLTLNINIDTNSDGNCDSLLPVELTSFDAKQEDDCTVNLTWTTASEENSSHFVIYRSYDGYEFEPLDVIEAANNSVRQINYNFIDDEPLSTNYYRLGQVDLDGTERLLKIVSLKTEKCNKELIQSIYPNPAKDELNLVFNPSYEMDGYIMLRDVSGRTIMQKSISLDKGEQTVHIQLDQFERGFYIVQFVADNGNIYPPQKLIINK